MKTPWQRRLRSAASGRNAVLLLVAMLSVAGFLVAAHVVDGERHTAARRQVEADAQQIERLLGRARTFELGLANALQGETAPEAHRFDALLSSATATVGLTDAMWVERVTARGRRGYERRIGAPITRPPGPQPAAPAATYLPATFVTGLPFRPGADMSGLPALAATLRSPASVFAGTATQQQVVAGQRGVFLVQAAKFGEGPGSQGFLVVFVPAEWLSMALSEAGDRVAVSLEGGHFTGALGTTPAASQTFIAVDRQWEVNVPGPQDTTLQTALPWLALAWPPAIALLVYVVARGMRRRRRAEHEVDDIFDLSQDLLGIVGVDGYLKRVNPAFESTLGYSAVELLEHPLLEFVHPDDRDATRESMDGLWKGHEAEPFESRYVRADGAVRWLQWNMRPMPQRGLMYAAVHDVTETRMLLQEQAALRRVATLVAEGHGAGDLFKAVAAEVGQLLGADATRLLRYEQDGTASVVAAHGASDAEIGLEAHLGPDQSDVWKRIAENVRSTAGPGPVAESLLAPGVAVAFAAPIIVSGRPWGVIVAKWKRAEEARPDTETRMGQFTELVATAVANADSRSELTASRRRVVAAADETRQRIERDLHDGAQQRLVQTMLTLKLAQRELGEDPENAAELVERALQSTESANDELRELARGIHPAVLTRGGLAPALKNVVRRSPIPVELDLRIDDQLPEHTQVTAYFVISEALTNAAKHSNASTVRVTVETIDGDARLSISDDGVGGADPARGSGLVGLKDRVEAAGGTLTVHSPPGEGTDLTIQLPLAAG